MVIVVGVDNAVAHLIKSVATEMYSIDCPNGSWDDIPDHLKRAYDEDAGRIITKVLEYVEVTQPLGVKDINADNWRRAVQQIERRVGEAIYPVF